MIYWHSSWYSPDVYMYKASSESLWSLKELRKEYYPLWLVPEKKNWSLCLSGYFCLWEGLINTLCRCTIHTRGEGRDRNREKKFLLKFFLSGLKIWVFISSRSNPFKISDLLFLAICFKGVCVLLSAHQFDLFR